MFGSSDKKDLKEDEGLKKLDTVDKLPRKESCCCKFMLFLMAFLVVGICTGISIWYFVLRPNGG
jgi:hypothetical protein